MPNLSTLKTIPRKLWDFLLSDKPSFVLATFALCVTLALIFNVDIFLAGTRFRRWALYLVPIVSLIYLIYCAFRFFVWLRNARRRLPAFIQALKVKGPPATEAENTMKLRTIWMIFGLLSASMVINDDPVFVSLSFVLGLLAAFLRCGRERITLGRFVISVPLLIREADSRIVGASVFIVVMLLHLFGLVSDEMLLGLGCGLACGFALFKESWPSDWQILENKSSIKSVGFPPSKNPSAKKKD